MRSIFARFNEVNVRQKLPQALKLKATGNNGTDTKRVPKNKKDRPSASDEEESPSGASVTAVDHIAADKRHQKHQQHQPTFTMKKPFPLRGASKIWGGLTDAFGHHHSCSHERTADDDRVQLLSVLATNRSFEVTDDSSSEDSSVARTSLPHSISGDRSCDESLSVEYPRPQRNVVMPLEVSTDSSQDQTVYPPPSDPEILPSALDVSAPSACLPPLITFEPTVPSPLIDADSIKLSDDATVTTVRERPNVEETNRPSELQWTFTLYDVDRKGTVTKEDIESLVHSIHDALSSIKITTYKNKETALTPNDVSTVGSLKVKLSVVSESNQIGLTSGANAKHRPVPPATIREEYPAHSTTIEQKRRHAPLLSVSNVSICGDDGRSTSSTSNEEANPADPCPKLKTPVRRRMPPSMGTATGVKFRSCVENNVTPSASTQKRTMSYPNNRASAVEFCDQCHIRNGSRRPRRDYVNLGDLENCCNRKNAPPSATRRLSCTVASPALKHCDRHCNCENRTAGTHGSKVRRSMPLYPRNEKASCSCSLLCCNRKEVVVDTALKRDNSINKENRNVSMMVDYEQPKRDRGSKPTHHQRQRHERSMRQVQEWILKEAAKGAPKPRLTSASPLTTAASKQPPTDSPQRCSKLTVEHRHYHEHRHVILPAA